MPTSPPLSLAALPFLLVAVSCHGSPSHVPRDETRHGASPFLRAQMRDHDAHGAALRDAVARADLIAARREAHALREVGVDGIAPAEGGEALEALHLAAGRLEGAIDLVEASRALADVARSCGDCHARLGGPRPIVAPLPREASGVVPRMRRHEWAVARMWDGLIVPSDGAWKVGASVLAEAPLEPVVSPKAPREVAAVTTVATAVREIANRAHAADSGGVRSELYAELITTCAACHARLGGGPSAEQR